MSDFASLTWAFENWFDFASTDLPEPLRHRAEREFAAMPWDGLTPDQRRSVALQLDYHHDPAMAQDRQFWWDFFERMDAVKRQIANWEMAATPTVGDLALKENRIAALRQELGRMKAQERNARGDYYPPPGPVATGDEATLQLPAVPAQYVPYPRAMHQLTERLGATPAELAAWVWMGPESGGIAAYLNANELERPPRYVYCTATGNTTEAGFDYVAPLMACWFRADDVAGFKPEDRYITGQALIDHWSDRPGILPVPFIRAKIAESRLLDGHPTYGGTQGSYPEETYFPPLTSGLFLLSQVHEIEATDFGDAVGPGESRQLEAMDQVNLPRSPDVGSPEWRAQVARTAANARHDQPGGSRDKKAEIRKIWASGKFSSRDDCAEQECAALGISYSSARKALRGTPAPSRC